MKNRDKVFILTEAILALLVLVLAVMMFRGNSRQGPDKVSVIVQNSDDNQWAAFKYGLKMAAKDQGIELSVVDTESEMSVAEQESVTRQEIDNGAQAVIVRPVPGADTEAMLKRIENSVPVMLAGSTASAEKKKSALPVTEPDHTAIGKALARELLTDYAGRLDGKTLGIAAADTTSEAVRNCRQGFVTALKDSGARIVWSATGPYGDDDERSLATRPAVDLVVALDDNSLTAAGECAAANNLHGAVVYGVGNSTEATYYLDTGIVECLVVPDEFNVGYQSLTEVAKCLQNHFRKARDKTVSYQAIRKEELFSKENQALTFAISQ